MKKSTLYGNLESMVSQLYRSFDESYKIFFLILLNMPILRVIRLASWECLPRGYKEQANNITVNSAIFTVLMFLSVLHVCFIFVTTYSVGCCHFTDKEIMNH